jgi:hypothetical protein
MIDHFMYYLYLVKGKQRIETHVYGQCSNLTETHVHRISRLVDSHTQSKFVDYNPTSLC